MDSEQALLSRMIATRGIDKVVSANIEPRHFTDQDLREVYETCVEHFRTWRTPPSPEAVKRRHPDYQLMPVSDDLEYLIVEFRKDCEFRFGVQKWRDIGEMLDKAEAGDQQARGKIAELFVEHARELTSLIPVPRSSRLSDMSARILTIKRQQEAGVVPGIKIGIPQLDPYVQSIRATEVCVHCGYSGRGKTTGLVRSGIQAYAEEENVGFVSLEMEEDEVWEMFDARVAELSRTAITRRELDKGDYERYERAAERVSKARNEIIVIDEIPGGATIDSIAALTDRYGWTTVCIDYISLMRAHLKVGSDWERVTEISHAIKQFARSYKVKVYVAAQNNRSAADDGPTEDNIAFSTTIFQDCNVMVGYHQDPEMERMRKVQIRLIKNRRGARGPVGQSGYGEFYEFWDREKLVFEDWTPLHEWMVKQAAENKS